MVVVDGSADRIPAGDWVVDAAVVSLVLGSVPDQGTAPAELARVLRPGGRLHFWEHVRAEGAGFALEGVESFRLPDVRVPSPTAPQILGTALRR